MTAFEVLSDRIRALLPDFGIFEPTPPQAEALPLVAKGENVLIIAQTGSGKTEAAVLPLLDKLASTKERHGISLLYITPLRALNRDMMRRLTAWCSALGIKIDIRHGDTPNSIRNKQSANPPDFLITTPETLQAILPGKRMRDNLKHVKAVVIDELHSLIESKRGVQLMIALERLRRIAGEFQIVALSATVGSPEQAARFLFGKRRYRIISVDTPREFKFLIEYPTPSIDDDIISGKAVVGPDLAARLSRIDELIEAYNSVLIFVNSRTLAEMLGEKLCRIRNDVAVHHSSLPREERERVESLFKEKRIKALVCTSTMELGIDIGSVDLVIHYMSPRQVTSLLQRVGRSGHRLGLTSLGVIICVSSDDIIESSAAVQLAKKGILEQTHPYTKCLDVMAHQIAGYLMDFGYAEADSIFNEIRKVDAYHTLERISFDRTLNYMAELHKLKIEDAIVRKTSATREYYFQNLSMIPDETRYIVIDVTTNSSIGILGEEFVLLKVKVGLHFILKGKIWQVEKISDDRKVYVTPVEDPLAAIPGWDGEMMPVPYELAQEAGRIRAKVYELLKSCSFDEALELMHKHVPASLEARRKVADEISEHIKTGSPMATDDTIVIEGFDKFLIIHACFGEAVNRTLGYVFEELLSRDGLIRLWWMDGYRILFELTVDTKEMDMQRMQSRLFGIKPEELEEIYYVAVQRNFPFPERVKVIAQRFGAVKRGAYISHPNLCSLPTRFERTPVYEEALQETSRDLIDLARCKQLLELIQKGRIQVKIFRSDERPTPFAYNMLYRYMDMPELVAPDSLKKSSLLRLATTIRNTYVAMLCLNCGASSDSMMIGKLEERPRCSRCSSSLLTPVFYNNERAVDIVKRKLSKEQLDADDQKELSKMRMSADLVLSYGKRAVQALAVYGIGPQTAARILAMMHEDEESFLNELLSAELRFIKNRQYWT